MMTGRRVRERYEVRSRRNPKAPRVARAPEVDGAPRTSEVRGAPWSADHLLYSARGRLLTMPRCGGCEPTLEANALLELLSSGSNSRTRTVSQAPWTGGRTCFPI